MKKILTLSALAILAILTLQAQEKRRTPIMGWSSWNHFRLNINEDLIKAQADAMVEYGMTGAGYEFINIDDGFFGGRDEQGRLISHPEKFPGGMRALSDYIHSLGLKAGIYTDAGHNTCICYSDDDPYGIGAGLYRNEEADLKQLLVKWNYDFIKVDWCGGKRLLLSDKKHYTLISEHLHDIKPQVIYNVCRWKFPGKWVTPIADSWRMSGDIDNQFSTILKIVDKAEKLAKYSSPGHVNDLDMLQVGRGMSYDEDKVHFSMWCMLNSPLLAGNDLRTMSQETLDILTNKEVIALNQDPMGHPAVKLGKVDDCGIWVKPLKDMDSGEVAIGVLNRSEEHKNVTLDLRELGLEVNQEFSCKDLWTGEEVQSDLHSISVEVNPHGITLLRFANVDIHPSGKLRRKMNY